MNGKHKCMVLLLKERKPKKQVRRNFKAFVQNFYGWEV